MKILTVDPGIDDSGWACFDAGWGTPEASIQDSLEALELYGQVSTTPGRDLALRLQDIGRQFQTIISDLRPSLLYVETPPYEHSYTGGKERRASVNKLYMAIGAICGSADGRCMPRTVPVVSASKEDRNKLLRRAAKSIDLDLPVGPRGGARQDQMDAIWIGVQVLQSGAWRRENTGKNRGEDE